jgi:uncharacterized protein
MILLHGFNIGRLSIRRRTGAMHRYDHAMTRSCPVSLKLFACMALLVVISTRLAIAASSFEQGLAAYELGDFSAAHKAWQPLAKTGDAAAQHNLAVMYDHGQGVGEDDATALHWYRRAAENGHAASQYTLGLLFSKDHGVERDMRQALVWYKEAANQGHVESAYILGVLHDFGKGVRRDDVEAVKWYRKAAERGDARAQYNLALMYDFGQGGLDDSDSAVQWYRLSAAQGNAKAQYMLGVAYLQGDGVVPDNQAAYAWMTLAAANGHVRARQFRAHPWNKLSKAERAKAHELQARLRERVRLRRLLVSEHPDRMMLPTVELVMDMQRVLAQRGLLDSKADGVLGPETRTAIRALQLKMRLPQTGEPSTELLLLIDNN